MLAVGHVRPFIRVMQPRVRPDFARLEENRIQPRTEARAQFKRTDSLSGITILAVPG